MGDGCELRKRTTGQRRSKVLEKIEFRSRTRVRLEVPMVSKALTRTRFRQREGEKRGEDQRKEGTVRLRRMKVWPSSRELE